MSGMTYLPRTENANERLIQYCRTKAWGVYGNPLPAEIEIRLRNEISNIHRYNFAFYYLAAKQIADRAHKENHPVLARGTAGSSLVAFLLGITGTNPLRPHYHCLSCNRVEYMLHVSSGFDLPDKLCPDCGGNMRGDGHNIPFESFAGPDGEREPAIHVDITGFVSKQSKVALQELFPNDLIVRCGKGPEDELNRYDKIDGKVILLGVRSLLRYEDTNGWLIIPAAQKSKVPTMSIPSDGRDVLVTRQNDAELNQEFFYQNCFHSSLLDFLHSLSAETGVVLPRIPMDDTHIYEAFQHGHAEDIPGFIGERCFQMLAVTKPQCFSDLMRVQALLHGTGVWRGNAEELLRDGTAAFQEVIACREDVFEKVLASGVDRQKAWGIMEIVRKGRINGGQVPESVMDGYGMPDWIIQSCRKVQYLPSKASATAFTKCAVQAMWFKLNYPEKYAKAMSHFWCM